MGSGGGFLVGNDVLINGWFWLCWWEGCGYLLFD